MNDIASLELKSVTHEYRVPHGILGRRRFRAASDISMRVSPGEVLGIVGESGSGKSTLTKIMLGLIRPSQGQVRINGDPADSYSRRARARIVQAVFQDPYSSLNPSRTVERIIAEPLVVHDIGDAASQRQRVRELCEMTGLAERFRGARTGQLSGGQRQRVAIARALALRPQLLICDEPTSALDVSVQAQILNLLLALQVELNLAMVLVSHNLAVIEHIATRVAVMQKGVVVEHAETQSLMSNPSHPYTRTLLGSVLSIPTRAPTGPHLQST